MDEDIRRKLERLERLETELELERARADREATERVRQKERADRETAERARHKERADLAEAQIRRTNLVQYLYNIQATISPSLVVEADRFKVAKGATNVGNKVYPPALRPWTEFPALHAGQFGLVVDALGDSDVFPSIFEVRSTLRDLSPTPRTDEQDVRPFIRAHVESPAQKIVNTYFKVQQGSLESPPVALEIRNNAYGLRDNTPAIARAEDQPPPAKRQSPDKPSSLAPDRWGVRVFQGNVSTAVLIGEYKAAHKARAQQFRNVLDNHPTDSLFVDSVSRLNAKRKHQPPLAGQEPLAAENDPLATPEPLSAENDDLATQDPLAQDDPVVPASLAQGRSAPSLTLAQDQLVVATVLCQAYHYMITSGLSYGYVASGECLVVLAVKDDANVLYFHFVPSLAHIEGLPTTDTVRSTPAATLTTLALLALETEIRSQQWVENALGTLPRWPSSKPAASSRSTGGGGPSSLPPPPSPPSGDNDKQANTQSSQKSPQKRYTTKRTREEWEERSRRWGAYKPISTLPYCTQTCLLRLSSGGTLDPRCPNTPLHTRPECAPYHAMSKAELCSLFRSQFAHDLDHGCECLDKYGMFGETGVLFKIRLREYGYTLVAKGVQVGDADALVAEAAIYSHCRSFQGVYIPVHLGAIELVVPYYTQSLAVVRHMMLMSWAGTSLNRAHIPEGIDLDYEIDSTVGQLDSAGISNGDWRDANLAWNEELKRVMAIDFNLAYVTPPVATKRPHESGSSGEREARVRKTRRE
jgi:hypothetical protein